MALLAMQHASPRRQAWTSVLPWPQAMVSTSQPMLHVPMQSASGSKATLDQSADASHAQAECALFTGCRLTCQPVPCVPMQRVVSCQATALTGPPMPCVPMQGERSRGSRAQPQKLLSPAPTPGLPSQTPVPQASAAKPDKRCCPLPLCM